ncbi:MAG: patatin-like phospholipase family protein, partial [Planctomycetes bacterium]|nr:patatin-like phospholipase family protein [Planctomycetota bacterium]
QCAANCAGLRFAYVSTRRRALASPEGIPIDGIVGTSVGSIVGAAYAYHGKVDPVIEFTLDYLRSDDFKNDHFRRLMFGANDAERNILQTFVSRIRKSLSFTSLITRPAIYDGTMLQSVIDAFVPDIEFEDLRIPFAVPTIDLRQPLEVLITEGSVRTAVLASCSLPGFFPPVEVGDMLLADVGVIGSVPVSAAYELIPGAMVIASDLSTDLQPLAKVERGWDSIMRCETIAAQKLNKLELQRADVVIRPDLGAKYWSDFSELRRMIEAGAEATRQRLGDVRNVMEGLFRFLRVRSPSSSAEPR